MSKIFKLHYIVVFFIISSIITYFPYKHEKKLTNFLATLVKSKASKDTIDKTKEALYIMNNIHIWMNEFESRRQVNKLTWLEKKLNSPIMVYGYETKGACGGYTLVLAQILNEFNYEIRPLHMLVNNRYGGHIVLEVKINDKWCVFDPLYNLSFVNKDNQLASAEEVKNDWNFYKNQLPPSYLLSFNFKDFRYTNWDKVPVLGKIAKGTINLLTNKEKAKTFSLRSKFINPCKSLFYFCIAMLMGYTLLFLFYNYKATKNK